MHVTLLMVLLLPMAGWQEPDVEAAYRADYAKFTDISNLADPADRATQFMDFQDAGFDERLAEFVPGGIQNALIELTEAQRADELYPLADRWDTQTGANTGTAIALQAAVTAQNPEMIVNYGETIYVDNPVVDIAEILAVNYSALDDNEKFLEYANVVIVERGVADSFQFSYNIFQQELDAEDWEEAADWASRLMALGSAPDGVSAAEWRNMGLEFQRTVARAEYEGGRWQAAIREYRTLSGLNRDQRAISNFYMGRSYFELGGATNVNLAMERFADAAVLNDPLYSDPAETMVREIYGVNTGGDFTSLNTQVMAPARARMR